jgi:hypothetical protein
MRARHGTILRGLVLAALGAPLLAACATGQYSYIADEETHRRAADEEASAQLEAPAGLIVVGGRALLPGAQSAPLAGTSQLSVASGLGALTAPGGAAARINSLVGGARPAAGLPGVPAVSVAGASTTLVASVTNAAQAVAATTPAIGGGVTVGPPPPISSVPGATPIAALIARLPVTVSPPLH